MNFKKKKTLVTPTLLLLLFFIIYKYHGHNVYKASTTIKVDRKLDFLKSQNLNKTSFMDRSYTNIESQYDWMAYMEEKYTKTNERIQEVCKQGLKQNNTQSYVPQKIVFENFLVDESHGLVFCANMKVSSSTWVTNFVNLLPPGKEKTSLLLAQSNGQLIRFLPAFRSKFKYSENWFLFKGLLEKRPKSKNVLSFSFVRHPFERLVSAYKDKVLSKECCNKNLHTIDLCKGHHKKHNKNSPTIQAWCKKNDRSFPKFVDLVLTQYKKKEINPHWKPYYLRCFYCKFSYNLIGRVETFADDFKYIVLKQKLEGLLDVSPVRKNSADSNFERKPESLNYFSQLSRKQIVQLYEMYQPDFDLFDYEADSYLQLGANS